MSVGDVLLQHLELLRLPLHHLHLGAELVKVRVDGVLGTSPASVAVFGLQKVVGHLDLQEAVHHLDLALDGGKGEE